MIGPVSAWTDLLPHVAESVVLEADPAMPTPAALERIIQGALDRHDLQWQPDQLLGQHLVLPYREKGGWMQKLLARTILYSIAAPEEIDVAIEAHIARIASDNGAGKVWFLAPPVHLIEDDRRFRACTLWDVAGPHFVLRTIYGHERQAK